MLCHVAVSCIIISPINVRWSLNPVIAEEYGNDFWYRIKQPEFYVVRGVFRIIVLLKPESSPKFKSCALCFKFSFNIFQYLIWFIVESINVNRPTALAATHSQIITPLLPCLTVGTQHNLLASQKPYLIFSTPVCALWWRRYIICSQQRVLLFPKTEEIYLRIHLRNLNPFVYWQLIGVAFYKLHGHDSEPFSKFPAWCIHEEIF